MSSSNINQPYVFFSDGGGLQGHPLVVEHLLSSVSSLLGTYHLVHEIEDFRRLAFPLWTCEVEFSSFHLLDDLFVSIAAEWRIAAEQDVKDDACRPYVTSLVIRP